MIESFRWKNCFADVKSGGYPRLAEAFLREVVEPSLSTLDAQIEAWGRSDAPGAPFMQSDTEELSQATTLVFCLSIQSMWERQLRAYLAGCAEELHEDRALIKRALNDRWRDLDALFFELRGVRLSDFHDYETLNLLQLLGNACRHGDGPAAVELWRQCPHIWPAWLRSDPPISGPQSKPTPPSIHFVNVPRALIRAFVDAIVSFWQETECIYLESLERKAPNVEVRQAMIRNELAQRRGKA